MSHSFYSKPQELLSSSVQLTIIIRPEVQYRGVVQSGACTRCRGNSEHIGEVLSEFGEEENRVCGCLGDGLVFCAIDGRVGYARLLQA